MKPTLKPKVNPPIPTVTAKENPKVQSYIENLKTRLNEVELRLEDAEKKIKQVANRMGL